MMIGTMRSASESLLDSLSFKFPKTLLIALGNMKVRLFFFFSSVFGSSSSGRKKKNKKKKKQS